MCVILYTFPVGLLVGGLCGLFHLSSGLDGARRCLLVMFLLIPTGVIVGLSLSMAIATMKLFWKMALYGKICSRVNWRDRWSLWRRLVRLDEFGIRDKALYLVLSNGNETTEDLLQRIQSIELWSRILSSSAVEERVLQRWLMTTVEFVYARKREKPEPDMREKVTSFLTQLARFAPGGSLDLLDLKPALSQLQQMPATQFQLAFSPATCEERYVGPCGYQSWGAGEYVSDFLPPAVSIVEVSSAKEPFREEKRTQ